jgi:hypothetical protein
VGGLSSRNSGLRLVALGFLVLLVDGCGGRSLEAFWGEEPNSGGGNTADGGTLNAAGGLFGTGAIGSTGAVSGIGGGVTGGAPSAGGFSAGGSSAGGSSGGGSSGGTGGFPSTGGVFSAGGQPMASIGGMGGDISGICGDFSCTGLGDCFMVLVDEACLRYCSFPSTVSLTTDAGVQSLAGLQCQILDGNLYVTGSELTSLAGLESIMEIDGDLTLQRTAALPSFQGLNGLEVVTGVLSLSETVNLTSLSGLESLATLGSRLNLYSNGSLADISALTNARGDNLSLSIVGNSALSSLVGLEGIRSAEDVVVVRNPNLGSIELSGLGAVLGSITVTDQPLAQTLNFSQLGSVGDTLTIAANGVTSVNLNQLSSAAYITITNNPELLTVWELPSLTTINALVLAGNPKFPQCEADAIHARIGACSPCQDNDPAGTCN